VGELAGCEGRVGADDEQGRDGAQARESRNM
jgi:hypothetical protein